MSIEKKNGIEIKLKIKSEFYTIYFQDEGILVPELLTSLPSGLNYYILFENKIIQKQGTNNLFFQFKNLYDLEIKIGKNSISINFKIILKNKVYTIISLHNLGIEVYHEIFEYLLMQNSLCHLNLKQIEFLAKGNKGGTQAFNFIILMCLAFFLSGFSLVLIDILPDKYAFMRIILFVLNPTMVFIILIFSAFGIWINQKQDIKIFQKISKVQLILGIVLFIPNIIIFSIGLIF